MGVITRRLAMEHLQNSQKNNRNTFSEQILSDLYEYHHYFQLLVEPNMIDTTGNLAQGVISEILKEITLKVFSRKYQKNIIIEQMMIYFLHAAQIDDQLKIYPKIITENRKSGTLDFEIYVDDHVVAKAIVTSKIN
ncbi:DNA-binding protein [Streptococcus uberis]|nr:DNA-binding protein [Streptococcus uberis]